jgi:hypothetical protein
MTTTKTVTTQQELDAALASDADIIYINSPAGIWLWIGQSDTATVEAYGSATVRASGSATVEAYGSATVRAYGSATVRASGSATVEAYGSATVRAYGSATVRAYGSATVRAYDTATVRAYGSATVRAYGSATVRAYGSATVRAYGSATVRAYGSATVRAYGSATVRAYGSATVRAYDTATVRAYGSATVRAYDTATVEASTHVAVHLHSARAVVTGGVLIDITALDLNDPATWCGYRGVQVHDGAALLYKAVNASLAAGHEYGRPTTYTVGSDVTADDWRDDHQCGGGLHVSPSADQAKQYRPEGETDTRYLRVAVALTDLRPIGDKAKARTVRVLAEVDAAGNDLASTPRITEESAR